MLEAASDSRERERVRETKARSRWGPTHVTVGASGFRHSETDGNSSQKRARKPFPQQCLVKSRLNVLGACLDVLRACLDVAVPPAASPQQIHFTLEQEAAKPYPNHDWAQKYFQLSDRAMTLNHELASGHAFAQHQLEVCCVPRISSPNPFLEQLETTVRNEVQKQLAEDKEQEEKRTSFLAKAPLLRLASDILSFTLAAVLPPPSANNSMDIWSHALAQDTQFAGHVKKMCQRNKCPVSEQRLATEFNQIRHDRHGRCLWTLCILCSHTAIS